MKKDEFHILLKKVSINKKQFSVIADTPYQTVVSWGVARKGRILEIPNWVRQFLKHYEQSKKFELLKNEICAKLDL